MDKDIKELIKNLKCTIRILEEGTKDEYRNGQLDMAQNIMFELQKIYLKENNIK